MTAEVAILNKQAVALAADSAVTTWTGQGQKVWNTVNKLFALSKTDPVGIMIYSSADIMGIPAETVIKVYRDSLRRNAFETLDGYHDHFLEFLSTDERLFPESVRIAHCGDICRRAMFRLSDEIDSHIRINFPGYGHPTQHEADEAAKQIIESASQNIAGKEVLCDDETCRRLRAGLEPLVGDFAEAFADAYHLGDEYKELLMQFCLDQITRDHPCVAEVGIVTAGYGSDEVFPSLKSVEFEASVFDITKVKSKQYNAVKPGERNAWIQGFAQTGTIESFVYGKPIALDDHLRQIIGEFFEAQKQKALETPEMAGELESWNTLFDLLSVELTEHFGKGLVETAMKLYTVPLLEAIASMPKEELATMAQALINLTAMRSRVTEDETVGGPVDVAVISKGDGFVWINRKHYFKPELNPGFVHNYFVRLNDHG